MAIVTKQVVQFETADGSVFSTEHEALAHEFKLENGAEISAAAEAFVNTLGAIDRSRNMKINTVEEFLSFYLPWVANGKPVVERTVFDTPKAEAAVEGAEASEEAKTEAATVADQAPATDEQPLF